MTRGTTVVGAAAVSVVASAVVASVVGTFVSLRSCQTQVPHNDEVNARHSVSSSASPQLAANAVLARKNKKETNIAQKKN